MVWNEICEFGQSTAPSLNALSLNFIIRSNLPLRLFCRIIGDWTACRLGLRRKFQNPAKDR